MVDLNHAYYQILLDEESKKLFVFYTPWGLYKYNTLAMGIHTAASECQEKMRMALQGLQGIQQIQDNVVVHGRGVEHDKRLAALLQRLEVKGFTLRREKCLFRVKEVM